MTGSLALRDFFVANALWELALAAIRTFVILWLTRGLGIGLSSAALVVGAAAVLVLAGAAVSGRLADRHGARRVMTVAVAIFGAACSRPSPSPRPARSCPPMWGVAAVALLASIPFLRRVR